MKRLTENARRHLGESLTIRWGVSRGRDTYGYTTCSLRNQRGKRVAACNGGGYDMRGTVIGHWVAVTFAKELRKLKLGDFPEHQGERSFYGLAFHDPNFDPSKAVVTEGQTVEEREAAGVSVGLERYQAFYKASSPVPTKHHTIPDIDGGCGESSVMSILKAIGLGLRHVVDNRKLDVYVIERASK